MSTRAFAPDPDDPDPVRSHLYWQLDQARTETATKVAEARRRGWADGYRDAFEDLRLHDPQSCPMIDWELFVLAFDVGREFRDDLNEPEPRWATRQEALDWLRDEIHNRDPQRAGIHQGGDSGEGT